MVLKRRNKFYRHRHYRKEKISLFFSLAICPLLIFHSLQAQKLATTQDGEIVALYDDGHWSYAPNYEIANSRNHQCNYVVNVVLPGSGKKQTVLHKATFISFTNDLLKKESRWQDHVVCEISIGEVEGSTICYIEYTLQTPYAFKYYGIIQEGRKLLLKLKDESVVELEFDTSDKGIIDRDNNRTNYHTFALLNSENIELLRKSEVKEVLMPWTMGNEKYPVVYGKLFIDQLPCLD